MNHRQRFDSVCRHAVPDRFPIDYTAAPSVDARVRAYYGVNTERDLLDALGCDFYYLSFRDFSQNESCAPCYRGPKLECTDEARVCPLGISWTRGAYASKFAADEVTACPLANATTARDVLDHPWPRADWFDFEPLIAECEANSDRVIVGGLWSSIFGDSYRMLGFESFLLNMAANPDMIRALVDRMTDLFLELNDHLFAALKGKLDVFYFGSDFGVQNGLLFSQPMWEDFFLDNIRSLAQLGHDHGLKVMMHSCGAISPLIPLLIEAGIDILDPVQVTAKGMDPRSLSDDHGDRIVFHGGVDTQQVLPNESPDGVYRHAVQTINALGSRAGYIFGPSQMLQADIPTANIDAMYRAAREHRPPRTRVLSSLGIPPRQC